jgi:mono/diheme cytochrome c family protein
MNTPRAPEIFKWLLVGVLCGWVAVVAAGVVAIKTAHGFSALAQPSSLERGIARIALSAAIPEDGRAALNPAPNSPDVREEARAHWADHCATCHANDGSGDTPIGKHLYPPAPDMRASGTQNKSDGELFFIIQNGVRLTGMPAWGGGSGHDAEDSWKLVRFIRYLPQMTFEEKKQMEKLNPKTPDELKEEQEEESFLKGESNEPQPDHSHHHH